MPADQIEATAAFGIGAVGDDAEVADPIAVAQQLALALANADRKLADLGRLGQVAQSK
jgi:hypothetical protein